VSDEERIVDSGPIPLSANFDLTANPTVERSSAKGVQAVGILESKQAVRAADAAHRRDEQRKDNEARRLRELISFIVIMVIVAASWGIGFLMMVFAENDNRQAFGQDVFLLVLGSILGALAGYFTGKAGK